SEFTFHPVANIFPMMTDEEFEALKADIQQQGLLEPIWLHDGKIIDGRNRYRACCKLGIEPVTRDWNGEGGSLVTFVCSLNLNRRHLSSSQKAIIAAEIEPLLAEEAKRRMSQGGGDKRSAQARSSGAQKIEKPMRAAQQAAEI